MTSVIDPTRMSQIRDRIIKWYNSNGRRFPWRETSNPYEILIAEMMLRRTTAVAVSRVFSEFIRKFPDVVSLSSVDENVIRQTVQSLGLQGQRSKHLQRMAAYLIEDFKGDVTKAKNKLLSIPGVGRYVESAVRNFAFGESVHIVDGNIVHLLQRITGISFSGANDKLAWTTMKELGSPHHDKRLYWGMIDLVAMVCLRNRPRCSKCPLSQLCEFNIRAK